MSEQLPVASQPAPASFSRTDSPPSPDASAIPEPDTPVTEPTVISTDPTSARMIHNSYLVSLTKTELQPPPEVVFDSSKSLVKFCLQHALSQGYATSVRSSNANLNVYIQCVKSAKPRWSRRLSVGERMRKRGSKRQGCPFLVYGRMKSDGWHLTVREGGHNHSADDDMIGHYQARRFNSAQMERIRDLMHENVKPQKIEGVLQQEWPLQPILRRDVYNAVALLRRREKNGLSTSDFDPFWSVYEDAGADLMETDADLTSADFSHTAVPNADAPGPEASRMETSRTQMHRADASSTHAPPPLPATPNPPQTTASHFTPHYSLQSTPYTPQSTTLQPTPRNASQNSESLSHAQENLSVDAEISMWLTLMPARVRNRLKVIAPVLSTANLRLLPHPPPPRIPPRPTHGPIDRVERPPPTHPDRVDDPSSAPSPHVPDREEHPSPVPPSCPTDHATGPPSPQRAPERTVHSPPNPTQKNGKAAFRCSICREMGHTYRKCTKSL